jgi:molybdate transport system substrate-binding protein
VEPGRQCTAREPAIAEADVPVQASSSENGQGEEFPEIRIFTARAIATVLAVVGSDFERTSRQRLNITTGTAAALVRRINAGEPFDLFFGASDFVDALIEDARIIPNTRTLIAGSEIGVEVRAGTPKPDISSVDAFKRALIQAKSIAYLKEGASGIYVARLLERLGIASAIEAKVTRLETDTVSDLVAKGDIELGMVVTTQILTTPGVALVGALPPELQSTILFEGALSADTNSPDAVRKLLRFLATPAVIAIFKSQGMEPGAAQSFHRSTNRAH